MNDSSVPAFKETGENGADDASGERPRSALLNGNGFAETSNHEVNDGGYAYGISGERLLFSAHEGRDQDGVSTRHEVNARDTQVSGELFSPADMGNQNAKEIARIFTLPPPSNDIDASGSRNSIPPFVLDASPKNELWLHDHATIMSWSRVARTTLASYGVSIVHLEEETDKVIDVISKSWRNDRANQSSPDAWLKGICFNVFRNYRKSARIRRYAQYDVWELPVPSTKSNPHEVFEAIEARGILLSILDGMKDPLLESIWWLKNFEECTAKEIAAAHNMNEKKATTSIKKAEDAFAKAKARYETAKAKERLEKRKKFAEREVDDDSGKTR